MISAITATKSSLKKIEKASSANIDWSCRDCSMSTTAREQTITEIAVTASRTSMNVFAAASEPRRITGITSSSDAPMVRMISGAM